MHHLSTPARILSALLLALVGLVGFTTAADAAVVAGAKPSCVSVKIYETNPGGFYSKSVARLTNSCSTTKHLKVIWRAGRDSGCLTVRSGATVRTQAPLTVSTYDRTVTC